MRILKLLSFFVLSLITTNLMAQFPLGLGRKYDQPKEAAISYERPKEYVISKITVSGVKFLDPNTLISVSGLNVNDKVSIPGERISTAIRRLMEQGIIEDVSINVTKIEVDKVELDIHLRERPRLNKFVFKGIRKGEIDGVSEKVKTNKGKVITDALIKNIQLTIKRIYIEKGFLNTTVQIKQVSDTIRANNAALMVYIDKKKKVKIEDIQLNGVKEMPDYKVLSKMKATKIKAPLRIFTPSKFIPKKFEEDKQKLVEYYNKKGYRDAQVTSDSTITLPNGNIKLVLNVNEGNRFYYRNITWTGNYLRKTKDLETILAIKKGDVYNPEELNKKINGIPQGDVSSAYMDDGYLFFQCEPVEVAVDGDSIDIEMRIREGKQATINRIILNGNTKTSDHVVMRELLTRPGQKFSKTDLIETQQTLSRLGYFDPQKIEPKPIPQADGTVDIEYNVEEKPSDNIELSGGWGGLQGFVGTFGVVFNNFSARNIGNLDKWKPLPAGDGQRLALRLQASGRFYQTYSLSFTEPWLGGKKPNSFAVSIFHTSSDNRGYQRALERQYGSAYASLYGGSAGIYSGYFKNTGGSITYGKRLNWPDRNFSFNASLSYQRYNVDNSYFIPGFQKGVANDLSMAFVVSRYSLDNPQFTRSGSQFTLSATFNPPYSLFRDAPVVDKFKWVEGHKWMFDGDWYVPVVGKLVLHAKANMGFLGKYSAKSDFSPFGRFILGGAGMGMQNAYNVGADLIGLRGYDEGVVHELSLAEAEKLRTSDGTVTLSRMGGIVYSKYATELRYPVSLNPQATIFILGFAEAGNSWGSYKDFNPFKLRRTAGVGARIFMPAFGMIGLDFGKGFDPIPGITNRGLKSFTFSIGQQIR
ncbi:outer membrane protein assembly complex, YaeT protein [Emticicia oligotrophica DSM 17448]|uniref:Outer membrane protein assembly factor BamA n=1 Tax=Emticicia oligotrophica (strain DSM 17448 / CIP 109782 / MTCC 6937 / GPTSA100-15) TaxID=929562 RepID=A0ABM5N0M0_EMTOG|nr:MULTISPECIES: outer membrane protein assembly factor BamA [Emticicia]AFK02932.1 outer membrane protein assembly complex, YaeT protein [Emticicia oligotrophica DSM 17448]